MKTTPLSVLLSVYMKENPDFLDEALRSLVDQEPVSEIVLVKDGPLTKALDDCISRFTVLYPHLFKIITLPENKGLGLALREGLLQCSNEYVARMDSDDISKPGRFSKQVDFLNSNPNIDVVGSSIEEFHRTSAVAERKRTVPLEHVDIARVAKFRNPVNHVTVMFRKTSVLDVGNYQDVPGFEDYDLWLRMLNCGKKIKNLEEALVQVRIGNDMVGKRQGFQYAKTEFKFLNNSRKMGFINFVQMVGIAALRIPLRLLPKSLLNLIYKIFLRKSI